jgi:4'-phosphopantetheinyl transferase EntD
MPLFYQHNINQNTKLGVWRIEEPESFFLKKVPLKRDVSHPHKRLQHLAGRYLLPALFENFPLAEIVIADTRKPFLENEMYHFSISHCGNFAAAIVSSQDRVGVDIEIITPRIHSIEHKFLSHAEQVLMAGKDHDGLSKEKLLTFLWSAKESVYKWYGLGQIDFRDHLLWTRPMETLEDGHLLFPFQLVKSGTVSLVVNATGFDDLVLTWVVSREKAW